MKLAKIFRDNIARNVPVFLSEVKLTLKDDFGIDVSALEADHVCYRTQTIEEYNALVNALKCSHDFSLLIESEIGGRLISSFSLSKPINIPQTSHTQNSNSISVVEIPSPKKDSHYQSGLEHAEFVIGDRTTISPLNDDGHQFVLNEFLNQHQDLNWSLKAKDKKINPDISLKIHLASFGKCSVKFHLMPLVEVIAAEKEMTKNENQLNNQ